ncbi:MAG: VOC family protein [Clostridia bacterium]|nr:VOC family protein [Clostridia bacterium]
MAGIVGTHLVAQVGFIVKDIEETKRKWAAFLGMDVPPTQPSAITKSRRLYLRENRPPKANSLLAFFDVGPGLQIELIQPNEEPSTWRNFLNEHGEGMHHLAFQVKDSKTQVENAEKNGLRLVQHGIYGDGSGEYNYLDAPDLKCIVELLESYGKAD